MSGCYLNPSIHVWGDVNTDRVVAVGENSLCQVSNTWYEKQLQIFGMCGAVIHYFISHTHLSPPSASIHSTRLQNNPILGFFCSVMFRNFIFKVHDLRNEIHFTAQHSKVYQLALSFLLRGRDQITLKNFLTASQSCTFLGISFILKMK